MPYSSDESPTFFTKLTQSGSIAPDFGYYPDSSFMTVDEMIVNDNNIISNGDAAIVKYLLDTATLSTVDATKTSIDISFENPVNQNLIYKSEEKVSKIEIYSLDGKLLKTVQENNSNASELPKGIYVAKVTFENGKISTKKLIRN
jgi:hypothetical protein